MYNLHCVYIPANIVFMCVCVRVCVCVHTYWCAWRRVCVHVHVCIHVLGPSRLHLPLLQTHWSVRSLHLSAHCFSPSYLTLILLSLSPPPSSQGSVWNWRPYGCTQNALQRRRRECASMQNYGRRSNRLHRFGCCRTHMQWVLSQFFLTWQKVVLVPITSLWWHISSHVHYIFRNCQML